MLKHQDIWRALDTLAAQKGISVSALAQKAGLDATSFNPSKRFVGNRPRWPSTESLAEVLKVTGCSPAAFVSLSGVKSAITRLPLLGYAKAGRGGFFDDAGMPTGNGWDEIEFAGIDDPHAFALEVSGHSMEPLYRAGQTLIISPSAKPRAKDRVVVKTAKGEILAKELIRQSAKKIELKSFNPAYENLTLAAADIVWMYRIIWVSQ
jgi:phage repressor protein C with HTH and peptisase S24 domain